ncbi:uncharacterized protein LOC128558000 [Mercenaria mercenaria]|uniref:uncharacterized protein LOC128558000 n=1 Tax=Mercenaria mercenaria TaxID=6596 RepID=UPI00234FAABC|nr:uncharacterized protein LOC128558000 [Mercenaria mercenaria]
MENGLLYRILLIAALTGTHGGATSTSETLGPTTGLPTTTSTDNEVTVSFEIAANYALVNENNYLPTIVSGVEQYLGIDEQYITTPAQAYETDEGLVGISFGLAENTPNIGVITNNIGTLSIPVGLDTISVVPGSILIVYPTATTSTTDAVTGATSTSETLGPTTATIFDY